MKVFILLGNVGWDPTSTDLPIQLVRNSSQIVNKGTWDECKEVVKSLYIDLILDHGRHFFRWDSGLVPLLHETRQYLDYTIAEDLVLESQWKEMMKRYLGWVEEMGHLFT